MTLLTLGRQPALALAELESLYGPNAVLPFGSHSALLTIEPSQVSFSRLGGSTRVCKVLTKINNNSWPAVRDYLAKSLVEHQQYAPEGKLTIGVSVIGIKTNTKDIERMLLTVKKSIKLLGRPVRIVPNKSIELNAAQVLHNNLTSENGWEIVAVCDGRETYIVQTVAIQNIEAYAARDQARPYRDAKVGMLPPKLAQIIINLASGTKNKTLVLDPFCGTGVVLQEATLMGFDVYGTDVEPRMIEYSTGNLQWLRAKHNRTGEYVRVELGDATSHIWQKPIEVVACETYLGQPYTTLPTREQLTKNIRYVDSLHRKFLRNIGKQLAAGTRLCIAVPAWNNNNRFLHLPFLDHLQELGYNKVKFVHVSNQELVYHREKQVVARELVVLEKD